MQRLMPTDTYALPDTSSRYKLGVYKLYFCLVCQKRGMLCWDYHFGHPYAYTSAHEYKNVYLYICKRSQTSLS